MYFEIQKYNLTPKHGNMQTTSKAFNPQSRPAEWKKRGTGAHTNSYLCLLEICTLDTFKTTALQEPEFLIKCNGKS